MGFSYGTEKAHTRIPAVKVHVPFYSNIENLVLPPGCKLYGPEAGLGSLLLASVIIVLQEEDYGKASGGQGGHSGGSGPDAR